MYIKEYMEETAVVYASFKQMSPYSIHMAIQMKH